MVGSHHKVHHCGLSLAGLYCVRIGGSKTRAGHHPGQMLWPLGHGAWGGSKCRRAANCIKLPRPPGCRAGCWWAGGDRSPVSAPQCWSGTTQPLSSTQFAQRDALVSVVAPLKRSQWQPTRLQQSANGGGRWARGCRPPVLLIDGAELPSGLDPGCRGFVLALDLGCQLQPVV